MPVIDDLSTLLPDPPAPPPPVDWGKVAERLGFTVPADYREFADRYPVMTIDNFLAVLRPGQPHGDLVGVEALLQPLIDLRADDPEFLPYAFYPEPGGLYPWSVTVNGETLLWDMSHPDGPVVVLGRSGQWRSERPTTQFLFDCLTRQRPCPLFPPDFPSSQWGVRWD
jgi:hypothetical protein